MLILSRKEGEEIVIGPSTEQTVVRIASIRGDRVRVGVAAPRSVQVHRREVQMNITAEKVLEGRKAVQG
jgi:carbon storage regulator